jgi:hypothetical protein
MENTGFSSSRQALHMTEILLTVRKPLDDDHASLYRAVLVNRLWYSAGNRPSLAATAGSGSHFNATSHFPI